MKKSEKIGDFAVIGSSVKGDAIATAIKEFFKKEFKDGARYSVADFAKKFAKWNAEKKTVKANTMPSVKQIQLACYLFQSERKDGEFVAVVDADKNGVAIVRSCKKSTDIVNRYFADNKAPKSKFDATALILGLLNSPKFKFEQSDLEAIQSALDLLKK